MVGKTSWLAVQHRIHAVTNCVTEELTIGIILYGTALKRFDKREIACGESAPSDII
jgi:hypothetical protein